MDDEQSVFPIIPLLSHTVVKCGAEGRLDDNCVVRKGSTQVLFFDFLITEWVFFWGLTFEDNRGVAIYGSGNSFSSAIFKECLIKDNTGFNAIQIYFDGDIDNRDRQRHLIDDEMVTTYDYFDSLLPNKQIYQNLISAKSSKRPQKNQNQSHHLTSKTNNAAVSSILERSYILNDVDDSYSGNDDNDLRRDLQGVYRGMAIVLFATDIIDNLQEKSAVMNIGGIMELIDSDVSYNEVGFATLANIYGGRLFMHDNVIFTNNYDKSGPVFVDKDSQLYLNQDVTGNSNIGSGCDIFLEQKEQSQCLSTDEPCLGDCCGFGDTTCDLMTESPSPTPVDDDEDGGVSVSSSSSSSASSATKGGDEGGACGPGCITMAVLIPMVVLAMLIVGVRRYRTRVDRSAEVNNLELTEAEPQPNKEAVVA